MSGTWEPRESFKREVLHIALLLSYCVRRSIAASHHDVLRMLTGLEIASGVVHALHELPNDDRCTQHVNIIRVC
eukprot:8024-Eustigmatos_ZCMA.PRE.1